MTTVMKNIEEACRKLMNECVAQMAHVKRENLHLSFWFKWLQNDVYNIYK